MIDECQSAASGCPLWLSALRNIRFFRHTSAAGDGITLTLRRTASFYSWYRVRYPEKMAGLYAVSLQATSASAAVAILVGMQLVWPAVQI
ncbi:hypothetical protein [Paraburkholderia adhaesiva]|uniref:hypothetical protein n=1 Tax=Paraburkholderia adhaesiva TaxID=2883244 RepID=UPI001F45F527|nr:hypothetical protein [Paraburkholderia adhaesiva]